MLNVAMTGYYSPDLAGQRDTFVCLFVFVMEYMIEEKMILRLRTTKLYVLSLRLGREESNNCTYGMGILRITLQNAIDRLDRHASLFGGTRCRFLDIKNWARNARQ